MKRKLSQNKIIALIPARQGSKRIKNKNIAKISNHPLIAYTINAAKKTNLFRNKFISYEIYIWLSCLNVLHYLVVLK